MLKIFLMALSLSLVVGCGGKLPKFPADYIYEVDLTNKICGKYKIVNAETLQFEHMEDLQLGACAGVFGFSKDDIPRVLDWSRQAIEEAKKSCK